jgi:hypothetical protein
MSPTKFLDCISSRIISFDAFVCTKGFGRCQLFIIDIGGNYPKS